jgi:hypothetical protein
MECEYSVLCVIIMLSLLVPCGGRSVGGQKEYDNIQRDYSTKKHSKTVCQLCYVRSRHHLKKYNHSLI